MITKIQNFAFLFSILLNSCSFAQTSNVEKSFDGFPISIVVNRPANKANDEIKKVIVFVHGSGPQNLDGDLSSITMPKGVQNFVYRDISEALVKKGFATVRYNKRAYEVKLRLDNDPNYRESEEYKALNAHPLRYFIQDLAYFSEFAKKTFPNAKIYILGHSEGSGVALNVAREKSFIEGVALIGFSNETISTSLFEQTVYRTQHYFQEIDKDGNNVINESELSEPTELARSLKQQLQVLDQNKDKKIDLSEYRAGSYSNLIVNGKFYIPGYIKDEADLPRPSSIIQDAKFKIFFLQGEWDNQTPAYHTQAIKLVNDNIWKKPNLKFLFFPKAGHALDPRSSINDLHYRKIPTETLNKVATELDNFL